MSVGCRGPCGKSPGIGGGMRDWRSIGNGGSSGSLRCGGAASSMGGVDRGSSRGNSGITTCSSAGFRRSEEHTSELQSLMRISYAVFCLKKKKKKKQIIKNKLKKT